MAITEKYCDPDLDSGSNDGTSEANAWQTLAAAAAGYVAGDRINLKRTASTHQPGGAVTFSTAGTATAPVILRAYASTIGDGGVFDLDMQTNLLTFSGAEFIVEGLNVTGSDSQRVVEVSGENSVLYRCKVANTNASTGNYGAAVYLTKSSAVSCYFINANTNAAGRCVYTTTSNGALYGCRIDGPQVLVFKDAYYGGSWVHNLFVGTGSAAGSGLYLDRLCNQGGATAMIVNNTFYNLNSGINIEEMNHAGSGSGIVIANNIFSVMGAYGIQNQEQATIDTTLGIIAGNAFHSCSTSHTNFGDEPIFGSITLSASPFVTPGSDFKLNTTSGGGADCRAAGIPENFDATSGTTINFLDVGALQHEDAGGSGGGSSGNMSGGFQ